MENLILALPTDTLVYVGNTAVNIWWAYILYDFFRISMMLVTVILFIAIVLTIFSFSTAHKRIYDTVEEALEAGKLSREKVVIDWEEVTRRMASNHPEDKREGVLLAEETFDATLRGAGYPGGSLESRMRKIPDAQLSFKEDIVWACEVANALKERSGENVGADEMRRTVYIFERAMKELNIL